LVADTEKATTPVTNVMIFRIVFFIILKYQSIFLDNARGKYPIFVTEVCRDTDVEAE
jgi:hypothetical protein